MRTAAAHLQRLAELVNVDAELVARVRLDDVLRSQLLRNLPPRPPRLRAADAGKWA